MPRMSSARRTRRGRAGCRHAARGAAAGDPGRTGRARRSGLGSGACSWPKRSMRGSPPTSRSARRSRPTIRCMSASPACSRRPRQRRRSARPTSSSVLDWVDLGGTLRRPSARRPAGARIIQVSLDHALHNGWSTDHQGLPPVDLFLAGRSGRDRRGAAGRAAGGRGRARGIGPTAAARPGGARSPCRIWRLRCFDAVGERPVSLLHLPLSWDGAFWPFRHPLDFLGSRWRRRHRRRPGHLGRRRAGAARLRPAAGVDLRRRRLPDGRHRALDGGALPHPAADRRRQQPVLLQRRGASGAHGARARPPRREQVDRPAHDRSRNSTSPAWRGRRARPGFGPVKSIARSRARPSPKRSPSVEAGGVAVVDVRVAPGYTPAMASALVRHDK